MRNIFIYVFFIFVHGCITETENCGYTPLLVSARHFLNVPINVIPNKQIYQTGDTLSIIIDMSDSIRDLNTEMNFKIKNFPFRPVLALYQFDSLGIYQGRGFSIHEVIIDNIYKPDYQSYISAHSKYNNERYYFSISIVLKKRGKYVFQMQDAYQIYDAGGNPESWKTYADTIDFHGKCSEWAYRINNMIDGSNNMSEFEKELVYIDKTLNFNNFYSKKYKNSGQSPFGSGIFALEEIGTFCFDVK